MFGFALTTVLGNIFKGLHPPPGKFMERITGGPITILSGKIKVWLQPLLLNAVRLTLKEPLLLNTCEAVLAVVVNGAVLSPKFQVYFTASVDVLVKSTFSPGVHRPRIEVVKDAFGVRSMVTVFSIDSTQALKVLVSFTLYCPGRGKVFVALAPLTMLPSGNSQVELLGAGTDVFVKRSPVFTQSVSLHLKSVFVSVKVMSFVKVSVQPASFVPIRVTGYTPGAL